MAALTQSAEARASADRLTPALTAIGIAQIVIALALLFGAVQIWNLPPDSIRPIAVLGAFVQQAVAVFVFGFAAALLYGAVQVLRLQNGGRLIVLLFSAALFMVALLFLGSQINAYIGLDTLAQGLHANALWLLGFPVGYALVWLGNRQDEDTSLHEWLPKIGLGIMGIALVVILWNTGLLTSLRDLIAALVQPLALATLGVMAVLGFSAIVLMREGARFGETIAARESWQGWLFLLPNFVNFFLFFAMPLLLSFYLSFTNYDAISRAEWVGLENYTKLVSLEFRTLPAGMSSGGQFSFGYSEVASIPLGENRLAIGATDPLFWTSLGNTFRYCIMLLILAIFPALLLAMLLNSKIPGMKFYRAAFFLPSIAAVVGVALVWQWLYDPVIGFVNYALGPIRTGIASLLGQPDPAAITWLSDSNVMLIAVVIMAAWQVLGFNAVIFLAGLQGVPRDLMEAATVDGAGPVRRFLSITLPLIAPTTFFVTVTTLIAGLQAFSEMFVLLWATQDNARLTTVYYLYLQGFKQFKFGNASAIAWVLFIIIFIVTLIQFRLSNRSSAYSD
jgi:multiple sugar transport system permease protein